VAEAVVETLEVIDVQHDGGDRPAVAPRAAQLQAEPLLHVVAVVEPGELVAHRLLAQFFAQQRRLAAALLEFSAARL